MKIGIYSSAARGSIGGAECSIAVLAEALAQDHDVEIVHHAAMVTPLCITTRSSRLGVCWIVSAGHDEQEELQTAIYPTGSLTVVD